MAKKNNKRKYAAIALGIVGIAGLSLASAAQLDVNQSSPLVGVGTDNGCDTAVDVAFTTTFNQGTTGTPATAAGFDVASIVVSDIATLCDGKDLTVYVLDKDGVQVGSSYSDQIDGASLNVPVTVGNIDAEEVYQAAVSIS